jgi:UDP-glucose 4-epimerase
MGGRRVGRRYLITGGAGFIGSYLAEVLLKDGHEVIALDNLSTGRSQNINHLEELDSFKFVHGSVLDELLVEDLVEQTDTVIHLAAAVGVKLIVEHPLRSLITNIRGSEVILAAAHRYRRKVLVASTSEIYGKNSAGPLHEESDRVLGSSSVARWGYSTSKAVDEILAFAYFKERNLPTITVRLFNTVGPRQTGTYGMVLPRFAERAVRGEPLLVYGDGSQTRCFCHVADVVEALVNLIEDPRAEGNVFNIGGSEEVSILELAKRVIETAESQSEIRLIDYKEAYEEGFEDMERRVPDTTRLERLCGWHPRFSLNEIISEVVGEFRALRAHI